jgi:hypothetical protein
LVGNRQRTLIRCHSDERDAALRVGRAAK